MKKFLNVINNQDKILNKKSYQEIHNTGLLHREIHVYFITPKKEIIFQHRSVNQKTYPGLLDATVGGHVEIGDSYKKTAIKETEEETGEKIKPKDLIFIKKVKNYSHDHITGKINNAFQSEFLYIYKKDISDLKIEVGHGSGFELWTFKKLKNLNKKNKKKFIPFILDFVLSDLSNFLNDFKF